MAATSPAPAATPNDDPRLGRPLCPDCYDYTAAVLFNACAGDLWRRFTTYLPRHLARLAGLILASCASWPGPVRQGGRIPGTRRHPLPRPHPPGRPRRDLPATPARLDTACCARPSPTPPQLSP